MDRVYKITQVQERKPWTGRYGTFNSFALQLEGHDGWVELSQKPETTAPIVGQEIFGHLEVQTQGENTFYKFRKGTPKDAPQQLSGGSISKEDYKYLEMMLEELTGRRTKPENPTPRHDVLPNDEDIDTEPKFDLSDIPF